MALKKLLEKVKKDLNPEETKEEYKFLENINKTIKVLNLDAVAELGGSFAKGTHIKGKYDADIFVRFGGKHKKEDISELLQKILKKMKLTYEIVHGSRSYYQIKKELTYEIVPVRKITDYTQAETVVDMSPLHVSYFQKKANENTRDDIRLTKQFMKSAKIYGAESHIQGFSGHVVDLLILRYGSFENLIKSATKWKKRTIIDIEKYHKFPEMSLNSSKIQGPLILVDPVQKTRNAAAAVSQQAYEKFIKKAKEFMKKPSEEFFLVKSLKEEIKSKLKSIKSEEKYEELVIKIIPLEGKQDVVGSKILKIKEYLETELEKNDFEISWKDWQIEDDASLVFLVKKNKLSKKIIKEGPYLDMKKNVEGFKKKHKRIIKKDGRLFAEEPRKYFEAKTLLQDRIKEKYVKDKCKKIIIE